MCVIMYFIMQTGYWKVKSMRAARAIKIGPQNIAFYIALCNSSNTQ